MRVAIDIETNALDNSDKIWVIVCKDIDSGEFHIFREVMDNEAEKQKFLALAASVDVWIGHHIIGFDLPVLNRLLNTDIRSVRVIDTFIISKLVNYSRAGHSIESYGIEFGYPKGKNHYLDFFKKWSQPLEDYCVRDVEICHRIYLKLVDVIDAPEWASSIALEQDFQRVVNSLHNNGFSFNTDRATSLLSKVTAELTVLDKEIKDGFPDRLSAISEIHPRVTKYGTLHKGDFRWTLGGDLSEYNGGAFTRCEWRPFNPSSHKQIIEVLHRARWAPTDKTKAHVETEREVNKLKRKKLDIQVLSDKLTLFQKTGYKINENNLSTLPFGAPKPARLLAKRILLESRRRTLTEWLGLVQQDGRIHGEFQGIGAWTHRMAHQRPNTANIPNEFETSGKKKLLGKELRALWRAPKNRLLVGVDAEGIQLRIFAHYIDDKEFTEALVKGKKDDKTDPHSLNARILGSVCHSRQAAKRFVYALLLGAGLGKLAEILEASRDETDEALARLMARYEGFTRLKRDVIPADAERGWFLGLDGRHVRIPGEDTSYRQHLCMSGYLQNGEAIIMKKATLLWHDKLVDFDAKLVNFVHDEWQIEVPNDMAIALRVASLAADSLRDTGEALKLRCPLAGSYWNDDHHDYTIGVNWSVTH